MLDPRTMRTFRRRLSAAAAAAAAMALAVGCRGLRSAAEQPRRIRIAWLLRPCRDSASHGTRWRAAAAAALAVVFVAAAAALWAAAPAAGRVKVTNFRDAQTVRYPVVLLAGQTGDASATGAGVINESSRRDTRRLEGLAGGGAFKALAELVPGENRLVIRCGAAETKLTLTYRPTTSDLVVRVFYWTDSTGSTRFQTPDANDRLNWQGKLGTAMKLMQCFTAERLNDIGMGRRTFNLELDEAGRVKVHLLRGSASAEEYRKMSGDELYAAASAELERQYPSRAAKDLVIPAFTLFDANTGRALAHTALGGGDLALFGGGDLFTWPDSLAGAQTAFMDARRVDPAKFFSDSVGRDTYWACASTTMGAALHELGHTFDLPHSTDPLDIMTRGHDWLNRFFTLIEPPQAGRAGSCAFKADEVARWSPVSGEALAAQRFFEPDKRKWADAARTTITLDRRSRRINIESPDALRYVGVRCWDLPSGLQAVRCVPLANGATEASVTLDELDAWVPRGEAHLAVLDGQGCLTQVMVKDLLAGPFVTKWQFADVTVPWPDPNSLPAVDAAKLAEIEASAGKAKLAASAGPYVDFLAMSGLGNRQRVAGYVMREIRTDSARRIRLLTGSDDSLRMWLNGRQVAGVLALRTATADAETTDVDLRAGANRLLVEVGQAGGGWGLMLRITDDKGNKLELTDDGMLRAAAEAATQPAM